MHSLTFRSLIVASELSHFECGVEEMDFFIHEGLGESLKENNCHSYVVLDENEEIVGFFSLMEDSLVLDEGDKYDLVNGFSDSPLPSFSTEEEKKDFFNVISFPVVDIAYLAVRKDMQRKGIGTAILNKIFEMSKTQGVYSFVTVDALYLKGRYRADTFYERKGFQRLYPPTSENTIRMYTAIF